MATNLHVKDVRMAKYRMVEYIDENERGFNDVIKEPVEANDELYIFSREVSEGFSGYDISKFKAEGGISDKNRYIPPESITIENSHQNITLPTALAFKNVTRVALNGKNVKI